MPKRSRDRRTTSIDALTARVDQLAGRKCIATYVRDEDGEPFMLLMGDGCPTCVAFKAEVVKNRARREAARPKPKPYNVPAYTDEDFQ